MNNEIDTKNIADMPKHCGMCGDTHTGECHPLSFLYYQCNSCKIINRIPWDSIALNGMKHMYCGCGLSAEDNWKEITHEQFQEIDRAIEIKRLSMSGDY